MPYDLSASRTYPVSVEAAFDDCLPASLPALLGRRYLLVPGVAAVRDQVGEWGVAGQTRTIVLGDRGTMRETLVSVDRPSGFDYRLDELTGAFAALVDGVDGRWAFEAAGTGCRVTWSWSVRPRGRAGSAAMPVFGRMWDGFARQALEELEHLLLR